MKRSKLTMQVKQYSETCKNFGCHNYITLRNLHQQLTYLIHEHDKSYIYVIISQQSFSLIKNEIKLR